MKQSIKLQNVLIKLSKIKEHNFRGKAEATRVLLQYEQEAIQYNYPVTRSTCAIKRSFKHQFNDKLQRWDSFFCDHLYDATFINKSRFTFNKAVLLEIFKYTATLNINFFHDDGIVAVGTGKDIVCFVKRKNVWICHVTKKSKDSEISKLLVCAVQINGETVPECRTYDNSDVKPQAMALLEL